MNKGDTHTQYDTKMSYLKEKSEKNVRVRKVMKGEHIKSK